MTQTDMTPTDKENSSWQNLSYIYLLFFVGANTTEKGVLIFIRNIEKNTTPLRDLADICGKTGFSAFFGKAIPTLLTSMAALYYIYPVFLMVLFLLFFTVGCKKKTMIAVFITTALVIVAIHIIVGDPQWADLITFSILFFMFLHIAFVFQRVNTNGAEQLAKEKTTNGLDINMIQKVGAKAFFIALVLYLSIATICARFRRIIREKKPASDHTIPFGVDDDPEWECDLCEAGNRGTFHRWPRLAQPLSVLCPECYSPHSTIHDPEWARPVSGVSGVQKNGAGKRAPRALFLLMSPAALPPEITVGNPDGGRLELPSHGADRPTLTVEVEVRPAAEGRFWSGSYDAVVVVPPDTPPPNRLAHEAHDTILAWSLVEPPPRAIPSAGRSFVYKGSAWIDRKLLEMKPFKTGWRRWRRLFVTPLPESVREWWSADPPKLAVWGRSADEAPCFRGLEVTKIAGVDDLRNLFDPPPLPLAMPAQRHAAQPESVDAL